MRKRAICIGDILFLNREYLAPMRGATLMKKVILTSLSISMEGLNGGSSKTSGILNKTRHGVGFGIMVEKAGQKSNLYRGMRCPNVTIIAFPDHFRNPREIFKVFQQDVKGTSMFDCHNLSFKRKSSPNYLRLKDSF